MTSKWISQQIIKIVRIFPLSSCIREKKPASRNLRHSWWLYCCIFAGDQILVKAVVSSHRPESNGQPKKNITKKERPSTQHLKNHANQTNLKWCITQKECTLYEQQLVHKKTRANFQWNCCSVGRPRKQLKPTFTANRRKGGWNIKLINKKGTASVAAANDRLLKMGPRIPGSKAHMFLPPPLTPAAM